MNKTIRNKEFAKLMKEYCEGEYHGYEFQDFLDIFVEVVQEVVLRGDEVQLYGLGTFKPRVNASRKVYSGILDKKVDTQECITLQFRASEVTQDRMRKRSRENAVRGN